MNETRVDLRHLLEDIRDGYPFPVEEAILTELMANSLDSGCSRIDVKVEPEQRRVTFVDNGGGMSREMFVQYHDIASTGKERGKGIGFAGVGAKLALLVCDEVITETRHGQRCLSSRWWLESDFKAPWEDMVPLALLVEAQGTGVRLHLKATAPAGLLDVETVRRAIRTHFYPLLDREFGEVLKHLYPAGVRVFVNDEELRLPHMDRKAGKYFVVRRGRRRVLVGIGFLLKTGEELGEDQAGLAISTRGKVIKRGWEWLGVTPKEPTFLTGVVEVPELVECLTTNKSDFLRDPNSLTKYYKCRKEIQEAVGGVLEDLGQRREAERKPDKAFDRLQREIDTVVGEVLPDFPELAPLFGRRKSGEPVTAVLADPDGETTVVEAEGTDVTTGDKGGPGEGEGKGPTKGPLEGEHLEGTEGPGQSGREKTVRRKRPGLMIGFDENTGGEDLAWLRENTLFVNAAHPAYLRVRGTGAADLYVTFAVASTLSAQVQEGRPPLAFLRRFMMAWGSMQ